MSEMYIRHPLFFVIIGVAQYWLYLVCSSVEGLGFDNSIKVYKQLITMWKPHPLMQH